MLYSNAVPVLQVVHRGRKLYPPRRLEPHDKLHGRLAAACARFGIAMPHSYVTHVCAFLCAHGIATGAPRTARAEAARAYHPRAPRALKRRARTTPVHHAR